MDRWDRIENACHGARDLRGEARERFLDERCGSDQGMRRDVEALLEQDETPGSVLNRPAVHVAANGPSLPGRPAMLTGRSVGSYEILDPIGSGGMGDVYRARDTTLKREVALKVLPTVFALDPDRLARFRREAELLAALNHPNIAAIYGVAESEGVRALVLELVEGPTLADRLAHRPIPLDEAVPIARQIVAALEAAHECGIVHRDLKPANIKVRPDGTVKVLDFGLAKALEPGVSAGGDATASPTITSPAVTRTGVLLGTAAYMSPEQAKGRPADKRSDVWAFGCVCYEMLTGRRAFGGEDVSDTLAAVLRGEPDWTAWPDTAPLHIRVLVEGCVRKDRKERIADISTARFVLNERRAVPEAALPSRFVVRQRPWILPAVVAAIAAIAGIVGWSVRPSGNEIVTGITRFSIPLSENQQFTNPGRPLLAISPDGTQVVYVANRRLYLRPRSEPEARPIAGTEGSAGVASPVFSPDGQSIAFWSAADRTLKRIAVSGGTAVTICPADPVWGVTWGTDGILFGQDTKGIMRVPAEGGTPEVLVEMKSREVAFGPQSLPGGRGTLFTVVTPRPGLGRAAARIVVQTGGSNEPQTLIEGGSSARYLPEIGRIVYADEGRLFAVAFDLQKLKVMSKPVPVLEGVARAGPAVAHFSVSDTGSLVYIPGPAAISTPPQFKLALLDEAGKTELLKIREGWYESPRVSPDGKQIALGILDDKEANIWIYDLTRTSVPRRLTFGRSDRFPIWSADGRYVAFQSRSEGDLAIFWQRSDFSGTPERITRPEPEAAHVPESWSPHEDVFTFSVYSNSSRRFSLWSYSVREKQSHNFPGTESTRPLASDFSPDGRWLAYNVSENVAGLAQATVFIAPYPPTGDRYQISETRAGFHPTWLPNGKLSYSVGLSPQGPQWVVVNLAMQPRFTIGDAVGVPNGGLVDSVAGEPFGERNYDFTPDGRRVGLVPVERDEASSMTRSISVVVNWFEELKQRVSTR
jgi:serine/threonine protein kinase/Tol biopolymer transport system component